MHSFLLRSVREAATGEVVDARITEGRVDLAPGLTPTASDEVIDVDGRWLAPGLWDAHVHFDQWAQARSRLDLSGTATPREVVGRVRQALDEKPGEGIVFGFGYRASAWDRQPTVVELDAVTGPRPVVLISGDMHNGWLNSAAMDLLGLEPRTGLVDEDEWFPLFGRLEHLVPTSDAAVEDAMKAASALGVVGIVDLEFAANHDVWARRAEAAAPPLRIRTGVYPDNLQAVLDRGLATGDVLDERGLVTMGPLKIISDGSLGTRTAHCCDPYLDADDLDHPRGMQTVDPQELVRLLEAAHRGGLEIALHALGDAAVSHALDAFRSTGARGSVEHAQIIRRPDIDRMADLGITASVQPAHLLDDRDVMDRLWADRTDRGFAFRTMADQGVRLALGSDAPVAPLDPWLAMAAGVYRSGDGRPPWHQSEALSPREAFAASTGGIERVRSGDRGDIVLLDADPFAGETARESAENLTSMRVAATFVGGRPTHWEL